jgi:hypothetical protein
MKRCQMVVLCDVASEGKAFVELNKLDPQLVPVIASAKVMQQVQDPVHVFVVGRVNTMMSDRLRYWRTYLKAKVIFVRSNEVVLTPFAEKSRLVA